MQSDAVFNQLAKLQDHAAKWADLFPSAHITIVNTQDGGHAEEVIFQRGIQEQDGDNQAH